jgi:hypothetical protein
MPEVIRYTSDERVPDRAALLEPEMSDWNSVFGHCSASYQTGLR